MVILLASNKLSITLNIWCFYFFFPKIFNVTKYKTQNKFNMILKITVKICLAPLNALCNYVSLNIKLLECLSYEFI